MSFTTLPRIGMGTFRLRGDDARDAVKSALSLGYRHIDTAQMYNNEAEVGDGITSSGIPRREIFLTTKIWHDRLRPTYTDDEREIWRQRIPMRREGEPHEIAETVRFLLSDSAAYITGQTIHVNGGVYMT